MPDQVEVPGYHVRKIERGRVGDLSKIREELEEAADAEEQGNRLMVLQELSDMIGAIDSYLQAKYNGVFNLGDLVTMTRATQRAFVKGDRK